MRYVTATMICLSCLGLGACGPTPQQQAFAAQIEAQCQAGDAVACHQRDGDPIEVARLEVACAAQNLQACQAVSNYRVQQQQLRAQQTASIQAQINSWNTQPTVQYSPYRAPQLQPVQLGGGSNYYYCNQLGSYVVSCR